MFPSLHAHLVPYNVLSFVDFYMGICYHNEVFLKLKTIAYNCRQECRRGGRGGQAPLLPFSKRGKGQECPFNGALHFLTTVNSILWQPRILPLSWIIFALALVIPKYAKESIIYII